MLMGDWSWLPADSKQVLFENGFQLSESAKEKPRVENKIVGRCGAIIHNGARDLRHSASVTMGSRTGSLCRAIRIAEVQYLQRTMMMGVKCRRLSVSHTHLGGCP